MKNIYYKLSDRKTLELVGSLIILGFILLLVGMFAQASYTYEDIYGNTYKLKSVSVSDILNLANVGIAASSINTKINLFDFHSYLNVLMTDVNNFITLGKLEEAPERLKDYVNLVNTAIAGFSFIIIGLSLSIPMIIDGSKRLHLLNK